MGGKRPNAGRPATPIDEVRLMALVAQSMKQKAIARELDVSPSIISHRIGKLRKAAK